MNLKDQIKNYVPFDETEEKLKEYFLKWMDTFKDVLTRKKRKICSSAYSFRCCVLIRSR